MDSAVVLMVLLAAAGLGGVRGKPCSHFVSDAMKNDIEALEEPLKLTDPDLVSKHLFQDLLRELQVKNSTFQKQEKMLLLNVTLNVYLDMFSKMLADPQQVGSQAHLGHLREKVLDLQKHVFQQREQRMAQRLRELAAIQVDDSVIQRKAINEFKEVFNVASEIGSKSCHHSS